MPSNTNNNTPILFYYKSRLSARMQLLQFIYIAGLVATPIPAAPRNSLMEDAMALIKESHPDISDGDLLVAAAGYVEAKAMLSISPANSLLLSPICSRNCSSYSTS